MPIRLDFKDDKLIIDVNFIMIDEFMKVKKYYNKSKQKVALDKAFLYIFFMYSLDEKNVFRDTDSRVKKEQVIYRVWKKKLEEPPVTKEEMKLIEDAAEAYIFFSTTEEERTIEEIDRKMEQIRYTIKNTKPKIMEQTNPNTGITSFVSNVDIINKAIKELPTLLEVKEKLIASMKRQSMSLRNKGGRTRTSFRERGLLD